jgi:hypothetical protein
MNRLLASHVHGEPVDPERITDPATRAVAHALAGDRPAAEASLDAAMAADPDQPITWEIAVVLHARWGEPVDETNSPSTR